MKNVLKNMSTRQKVLYIGLALISVAILTLGIIAGGGFNSPDAATIITINTYTMNAQGEYELSLAGGSINYQGQIWDTTTPGSSGYWRMIGSWNIATSPQELNMGGSGYQYRYVFRPSPNSDYYVAQSTIPDYILDTDPSATYSVYFALKENPKNWTTYRSNKTFPSDHGNSAEDAYTITSAGDLAQLAYNVNNGTNYSGKYFKQTADINLDGYGWVPIGSESAKFQGNYDGQNYTIKNLYINMQLGETGMGLFGHISRSSISNVNLQNCSIYSTGVHVGGIFGNAVYSTITHCQNINGSVSSDSETVGGIGGYSYGVEIKSTIRDCFSSGDVKGTIKIGGILGWGSADLINCVSDAAVAGRAYLGGIAGYTTISDMIIKNCAFFGKISVDQLGSDSGWCVGGIGGELKGAASECLVQCQFEFVTTPSCAGAIAGVYYTVVKNCSASVQANADMHIYFGLFEGTPSCDGCYSIINGQGNYSNGDFSSWVLDESRGELPTNKELFWTGAPDKTSDEIVAYLRDVLGFKYAP